MPYEDRYSGIVSRLRDTLRTVTLKVMGLFLLIAGVVGGMVGYALWHFEPKGFKNDKGKPIVWRIALTGAAVGLAAAFGAWFMGWI